MWFATEGERQASSDGFFCQIISTALVWLSLALALQCSGAAERMSSVALAANPNRSPREFACRKQVSFQMASVVAGGLRRVPSVQTYQGKLTWQLIRGAAVRPAGDTVSHRRSGNSAVQSS